MPAPRTHRHNTYVAHNRANLLGLLLVLAGLAVMGWLVYSAVAELGQLANTIAPCTDVVKGCAQ